MFSKSIGLNKLKYNPGGGTAGFIAAAGILYLFAAWIGFLNALVLYVCMLIPALGAALFVRWRRSRAGERVAKITYLDL
jgi:hypothetical protein